MATRWITRLCQILRKQPAGGGKPLRGVKKHPPARRRASDIRAKQGPPCHGVALRSPQRERLMAGDAELEMAMRAVAGGIPRTMFSDHLYSRGTWGHGGSTRLTASGSISGRFDSALTTEDNRRHWAMADGFAADAAANPSIRTILRNRARYEVSNNSYARGMVETLANDVIGTGPRLQIQTDDEDLNTAIELAYAQWCRATDYAEKLRTIKKAKVQDGEAFAIFINNPALPSRVKMDLRLVEADQIRFVNISLLLVPSVDGIEMDEWNNPVMYHVLRVHPGYWSYANGNIGFPWEYDKIPARNVLHWFRMDRPGQHRGLPEILPALPLYAQLRRYTLAVLDAAEAAADHAIVAKTQAGANVEVNIGEPFDVLPLERRMMTFLPEGYDIGQIKPEQPSTTYEVFTRAILCEIARCLNMPYNIAAGNSSGYNYASGRLDHQTYFKSIRVEREHCEIKVLDPVFRAWFDEAILVSDYLPLKARTLREVPHQWHWDGHEHVDPLKEANAQTVRLAAHTTTLATEYARQGQDWEKQLRQRAKELALMTELGLSLAQAQPGQPVDPNADDEETPTGKPPAPQKQPAGAPPDEQPSADDTEDI